MFFYLSEDSVLDLELEVLKSKDILKGLYFVKESVVWVEFSKFWN